jgi:hypothetical protein
VFISHDAARDEPIASAVVDLLQLGIGIGGADVFCTSQKGQGVAVGKPFIEAIRDQLVEAKSVLALLTENYWHSPFCVCELGAVWYDSTKSFTPILVPPLAYADLKGVIHGVEALKLDSSEDLDRLRDQLVEVLGMSAKAASTPKWNNKKRAFLDALPSVLKRCPFVGPVPRERYNKVEKERTEYQSALDEAEAAKEALNKRISELENTKDRVAVAEIRKRYTDCEEQFEDLAEGAKKALRKLPRVVRDALFHRIRGASYDPPKDDWPDVKEADEEGYLNEGSEGIDLNEENKGVAAAVEAIDALVEFLDEPPKDFENWYHDQHGSKPDITRRPFWRLHLIDGLR